MKGRDKIKGQSPSEVAKKGRRFAEEESSEIEREQTQEALLEAEKRFRVIFDASLDALIIIDSDSGHILRTNPAAHRLLGYAEQSLTGKHFSTLFPPPSDLSLEDLRECIEVYGAVFTQDFFRADGSTWLMDLTATLIPWSGKSAILATLRDISERVQAEEEKAQLEAQLRQAHKMEAIGTLAGGIAHDFNNILSIIVGHTELAMDDVPEWNAARDNLNEVRKACLRARDLVRQILTFTRGTEQSRVPVEIGPLFEESLKLLRASIPTTISLQQRILSQSTTVVADPTQLSQVLVNLCTNAAHSMAEEGGTLEVTIQDVELDETGASLYGGLTPGTYVRLTVNDTGHGIDPHFIDRIFDPYFTTKEANQGTGVGLSVVHGIVTSCGGSITVDSAPGEGSTFDVFLPGLRTDVKSERNDV
ncbi:MAG: PAS domain S-box protein [Thermodesulfobacteriota bacterium]|nr:PAS domain S-box protein [Thermodesulfobacteriota bacterium]